MRSGICPKCGGKKAARSAAACASCYRNRGNSPPRVRIGDCGHPVSRTGQKSCRACYDGRGRVKPKPVYIATGCGHQISKPGLQHCRACYDLKRKEIQPARVSPSVTVDSPLEQGILDALKTGAATLEALGQKTQQTPGQVLDCLIAMKGRGLNVHALGEKWSLERHVPIAERTFEYVSRPDHTFVFGVSSDQHLCSRYAREDVVNDLYDRFQSAGVDRVLNAGNWIDGEDDKNRFDLSVHGLEPQVKYLAEHYPKRDGIVTYAIWGEDHEGWYARREAIDVGRFTEGQMRQAGRDDWFDLGFVEAKLDLINAHTGKRSTLVVMHPGGGSSYAYSYRPQKITEAFSGGEKPSALIIGHYHKLSCNIIRNVWNIQAGCGQDQTVFMRKKGLEAHVGGLIVTLKQDPETGAIYGCLPEQFIYYDTRYFNDRWSKTRPVVQAPRYVGGLEHVPQGQRTSHRQASVGLYAPVSESGKTGKV